MVNHRASQVETLFDALEEIGPKLKALGAVGVDGTIAYAAEENN